MVSPQKTPAPSCAAIRALSSPSRRAALGRGSPEGWGCAGPRGALGGLTVSPLSRSPRSRSRRVAAPGPGPAQRQPRGDGLDQGKEILGQPLLPLFGLCCSSPSSRRCRPPRGALWPRGWEEKPSPARSPDLSIPLNRVPQPMGQLCWAVRPQKAQSMCPSVPPAAAAPQGCPREDPGLRRVRREPRGAAAAGAHPRHPVHGAGPAGSPQPPRHRPQFQRGLQPCQNPPEPGCSSGR